LPHHTRVLFPNHLKKVEGSEALLQQKLADLGPMKREEKSVLAVFSLTSFLWITQQLFNAAIGSEVFNDTNIAIGGGILMFITPIDFKKGVFLLEWNDTRRLPWGILLLFGGGICLAKGMEVTGIVTAIGETISSQHHITLWLLLLVLITMSIFLTEIMSNVALVTIFIPVVFGVAEGLGQNPILLAIPVTFAASCAFMLPISTPPNAIVFASGHIRVKDMVRAGLLLNTMSVVVLLGLSLLILQHLTL
ncbi:MAG: anion transporter, partial [Bacteroidia bacterium]|nr:anion transporter [Bacteroidia bacterium]